MPLDPQGGCDVNGMTLLDHGVSRPIQSYHGVSVLAHPPNVVVLAPTQGATRSHIFYPPAPVACLVGCSLAAIRTGV
jgi:hypothetical protein